MDTTKVISHINTQDKIPNHDGILELIDEEGVPIGEIKTQIKTLRPKYKTPSYSVSYSLLAYVRDTAQIPFLLIAIDRRDKKAYWKYLSKEYCEKLINRRLEPKETTAIQFDLSNEISLNSP